ncbi:MAG: hypothetical protein DHS20C16_32480 [Phycisphaerae bacterium]|nr:MAG: hypothetical protein DHS20C16_32480 [Phycisphaerae bacterium]
MIPYILYVLFALGGAAIYLAMPKPSGSQRRAALILGVGVIAGFLGLMSVHFVAPNSNNFFFYMFAGIAVLAAGRVVTHPVPTYSAVYFALVILCVAVLLVIQRAEFLAVALIIIYAGAILVTYAFVIMLAQQSGASTTDTRAREPLMAILVSFVIAGAIAGKIEQIEAVPVRSPVLVAQAATDSPSETLVPPIEMESGHTKAIGQLMFGPYLIVVELSGILLLIAMVGAIAISRKQVPIEDTGEVRLPVGQIGREVPPF